MENLLRLNLQHFAEESGAETSPDGAQNTEQQAQKEDAGKPDHMIPKSRFDEVNAKYKDVQTQLEEFKTAQKASETKVKEEAGEFKQLYESMSTEYADHKTKFEAVEARNKELEGVVAELLTAKLATIPEDYHDLIPENLATEAKLSWISKAEEKGLFGKKEQKPVGSQTNADSKTGITKEQFEKMGYSERVALNKTNPELYRKLSK